MSLKKTVSRSAIPAAGLALASCVGLRPGRAMNTPQRKPLPVAAAPPQAIERRAFRLSFWMGVGGVCLAIGCGLFAPPSEEEIRAEFATYVGRANSCQDVSECVIVAPGCPLGCFVAVAKAREVDVRNKAKSLIDDYQRGGPVCVSSCAQPGALLCEAGHCALGAAPAGP